MNKTFYQKLNINLEREPFSLYIDSPLNTLVEKSVLSNQGHLTKHGALVVKTGKHTGRSAGDKYIVMSESTKESVWWENSINEMSKDNFEKLKLKVIEHLNIKGDLFITERSVGSDPEYNVGVCLVTNRPQHALFSKYLFRHRIKAISDQNDFLILHAPDLILDPKEFDTKTGTVITTCFDSKVTIITGTFYAGEIKKSMFSILNYILPSKNVLPMHSGANELPNGEVSVFFGLSGTGKTTLSTDENTSLIGDDEHGLSDNGVFNFEGGCYAKTFKLSQSGEPQIFSASSRFGAILENVVLTQKTGEPDFFDDTLTENGRSSYPLDFIDNTKQTSRGEIPKHLFFLTADAFGVLPPISKLTKSQAMFYFVLGYTAKLAGTEIGIKEPQSTFSPCFGAPFMLRHPSVYAELLGQYLEKYNIKVWLINTGWTGGAYGVGKRFPLNITRQIIRTVQNNTLNLVTTEQDDIFGLHVPTAVRNVPTSFLYPKLSWKDSLLYDEKAKDLATSFHSQMKKFGSFYDAQIKGAPLYNGNS